MGTTNLEHVFRVYGDNWKTVDVVQFRQDVHAGKFIRDGQCRDATNDKFILLCAVTRVLSAMTYLGPSIRPGMFTLKDMVDLLGTFPKINGISATYRAYLDMATYGLFIKPEPPRNPFYYPYRLSGGTHGIR